jgi:hypothetical protein
VTDPIDGRKSRCTVTFPPELYEKALAANPNLAPSELFQEALRRLTGCEHDDLACARCGAPLRQVDIVDRVLTRFYLEVQELVGTHARRGRSVEGLTRPLKALGQSYRLRVASETPLPGMTREERRAAKVKDLPPPPKARALRVAAPPAPAAIEAS